MNRFINSSRAFVNNDNNDINNNINVKTVPIQEEKHINYKKDIEKLRIMKIDNMETEIEYHIVRRKLNFKDKYN